MRSFFVSFWMILLSCSIMSAADDAQMRSHIRSGNSQYRDSLFAGAELKYRRALAINPTDTVAMFNLANALIMQQDQAKLAEADSLIQIVNTKAEQEGNRNLASKCFYQHGELAMLSQQYDQAANAFKESLKRNPSDDNARYNYLLAKKLLEQQQQDNQDQNKDQDQQQQQQQQEQQDQQQDKQDQNQEQQDQQQNQQDQQQQQEQNQEQQMSQDQMQSILEQSERDEKETQAKVMQRQQEKDKDKKKEMEARRRNGTLKDW